MLKARARDSLIALIMLFSGSESSGEEWDRWDGAHGDEYDEEEHYLYEDEIEKWHATSFGCSSN